MKVAKHPAESYHISNGYDGACIFLRHGPRDDGGSWGYVSIVGSFGSFGHYFGHCGGDFKSFLCSCDKYYLTGKFFGVEARVFDCDKTIKALRKFIVEQRRDGSLERDQAREMFDSLDQAHGSRSEEGFFTHLSERWEKFYEWEVYSMGERVMNPQAVGFFDDIWPGFVAELRSEAQQVAA